MVARCSSRRQKPGRRLRHWIRNAANLAMFALQPVGMGEDLRVDNPDLETLLRVIGSCADRKERR
jgi:hypothetical protein